MHLFGDVPMRRGRRWIGWSLVVGAVLFVGAALALATGVLDFGFRLGGGPIGLVVFISGLMIIRGRRHLARGGEEAMATDPRPPVLYLRQFSDDGAKHALSLLGSRRRLSFSSWVKRTYEERIGGALAHLGPMVAIGRPDEPLPELGSARIYVGDDAWQAKVGELIDRSGVVILQIGETEGIRWEVAQMVGRADPGKLVLALPMDEKTGEMAQQNRYDAFLHLNGSVFPKPLPKEIGRAQFIYFDQDWAPRLLTPSAATRRALMADDGLKARPRLRVALDALNDAFLRTPLPYGVRLALVVPVLLVYLLFGALAFQASFETIGGTTFLGLFETRGDVYDDLRPEFEALQRDFAEIAEAIGEVGSVQVSTPKPWDPPPVYDVRAKSYNADIVSSTLLEDHTVEPLYDLYLSEIETGFHWVLQTTTVTRAHGRRAPSDLRRRLRGLLETRYLVVLRPYWLEAPKDGGFRLDVETLVVDLRTKSIIEAFVLRVRNPSAPSPPAANSPKLAKYLQRYGYSVGREKLAALLAEKTGGTFRFDR